MTRRPNVFFFFSGGALGGSIFPHFFSHPSSRRGADPRALFFISLAVLCGPVEALVVFRFVSEGITQFPCCGAAGLPYLLSLCSKLIVEAFESVFLFPVADCLC